PFFRGAGEQLLQNLSGGAVDRGGRDAAKIGAAPPVVSPPPCDHLGHDLVGDVSQCLALQVRTGRQSVEVGESLIGAALVLPDLLEHTRRVYEHTTVRNHIKDGSLRYINVARKGSTRPRIRLEL